jgi:hypothetical protein
MTEALTILPDGPLRVIPSEIGPVVPVVDIAALINYTPDHLTKKIRENPDVFKGRQVLPDLPTAGGMQRCVCLDRVGFDRLLLLLKPAKTRDIFERIEAFRLKAFGQLAESKKEITPVQQPTQDLDEVVAYGLIEAKQIAELTGTDPKAMQAAALRKMGYPELADVLVPPAPAYIHGEPGWYIPTELAALCNDPLLTAERLNQYLANNRADGRWQPFQYREGHLWRLTALGRQHGREYEFTGRGGHKEPRIEWRESVLYASGLKRQMSDDQTALMAKV